MSEPWRDTPTRDRWLWRTVHISYACKQRSANEAEWEGVHRVSVRYRPGDLGSVSTETLTLEREFRNALLSMKPFTVDVEDDVVEAP